MNRVPLNVTTTGDVINGDEDNVLISEGDITINTTRNAVLKTSGSSYDPSYCSAIKCDSNPSITCGTVTAFCSGRGRKEIFS